jgi:excinuclease UvrABC helicase subunit UvrB
MEKLYSIYKQLFGMENQKTPEAPTTDNEWTMLDEGDYEKVKHKLDKMIKDYNLSRHETETEIDGQKYTVESWLTDKGEMVIQRIYQAKPKEKPDLIKELQDKLNQAVTDENYEEAARIQSELNKLL